MNASSLMKYNANEKNNSSNIIVFTVNVTIKK